MITFAGGTEAIDFISATSTDIYVLVRDNNSDNANRSIIYKYNVQNKELQESVLKESDQDIIVGLSCYNNKIFTVAEKSDGIDTEVSESSCATAGAGYPMAGWSAAAGQAETGGEGDVVFTLRQTMADCRHRPIHAHPARQFTGPRKLVAITRSTRAASTCPWSSRRRE